MSIRSQTAGSPIHINAHDGGKEVLIYALGVMIIIVPAPLISQGHIQVTIRAEVQVAPVMIESLIVLDNVANAGGRIPLIGVGGRNIIARQNVMASASCRSHRVLGIV